ncbi:hypothetical protein CAEBREN_28555 [Caenorhabditis brenneri]|uniref:T20D4.11-like domain-containing protein n=1 Tax=Caenorhabditis brenneri TaxID=135651 RepID=G0M9Z3_CAEBE|nr:hypothetical protein CAEBREN_28555 [Caenorhabditis brenneri]
MYILILITLSIFGALGAPSTESKTCTTGESYLGITCAEQALDFSTKISRLDTANTEERNKFKQPCEDLDYCYRKTKHCEAFDNENVKEKFALIQLICKTINFVTGDFAGCEEELRDEDSDCFKNFDMLSNNQEDIDFDDEDTARDSCQNFFGKEGCLKREVEEHCGSRDWEKLKNFLLSINDKVKQCDQNGHL